MSVLTTPERARTRRGLALAVVPGWALVVLVLGHLIPVLPDLSMANYGVAALSINVPLVACSMAALSVSARSARAVAWATVACLALSLLVTALQVQMAPFTIGTLTFSVATIALAVPVIAALRAPAPLEDEPVAEPPAPSPAPAPTAGRVWGTARDAAAGAEPEGPRTIADPTDRWRRGTPTAED